MLFAEIGDQVWNALIAGTVTVVLAYMQLRTKMAIETTASNAAKKVDAVKTTLETATVSTDKKLAGIAETVDEVHTLTNHAMEMAMKTVAELSSWKAQSTKDPKDIEAAEQAERVYKEHVAAQAKVDKKQVVVAGTMTVLPN